MKLSAEKIQANWIEFNTNIETYITGDRKQKLLDFYQKYEDRIILMPAAHKKEYHSAFPGGYVDHVNRVVKAALSMSAVWEGFGCDMTTFTQEELVFSAINHDLGKMGSDTEEAYVPQTDNWRRDKLGEDYMFNKALPFAAVPDRGLFLLQQHDIKYLHQADMMAARIEFEIEWLPKFSKNSVATSKKNYTLGNNKKTNTQSKALSSIKSSGLKNMLDNL